MRRKLISALATRFEGVEAKTLGRIADKLLSDKTIETDEDVNSAVEEVTFADILKSYGDSRAAEASKSAVSNYEKKHGLKNGKPSEAQTDPDDDDDADPDEGDGAQKKTGKPSARRNTTSPEIAEMMKTMQTMAESLKGVNAELQSLKQGRVAEKRKSRLAEVIKGLPDSQKKAYNRLPLDGYSEEEFETLIDEVTGEVAQLDKENKANGGGFKAPLSGGGGDPVEGEATDAEISAIVEGFNL